jgi:PEP-CTERM motif
VWGVFTSAQTTTKANTSMHGVMHDFEHATHDLFVQLEQSMKLDNVKMATGLLLAAACGMAQATSLASESATSSVDMVGNYFGGTLLETAITNISNESYAGVARTAVYDTGAGLDFYYQFSNSSSSLNGIERFSAYDFGAVGSDTVLNVYQTAAAFGIFTAGTEAADYADRSRLGVIGFSFVPNGASKVNPGTTSYTTIIRTDARDYEPGHFGLLDGIGDNAVAFAPASVVPEPTISSLLLLGLGALCLIGKRKLRQR